MSNDERTQHDDPQHQGRPPARRTSYHKARREVDVQADRKQRSAQLKRRRKPSSASQRDQDGDGGTVGHAVTARARVPAIQNAGARIRHRQPASSGAGEEPQRRGSLADQQKYPLNMSTGPTVEVDGTLIKITP